MGDMKHINKKRRCFMRRKILSVLLTAAVLLGLIGCGNGSTVDTGSDSKAESGNVNTEADSKQKEYAQLVVAFRTAGAIPTEQAIDTIEEEINKITRDEIGAEVELMIIANGSYVSQMNLMLTGDEQIDVLGASRSMMPTIYAAEQIRPLQELLDEYGQGIKEVLGEDLLSCGAFHNELYAIPIKCDSACGYGTFALRTDLCKKYNIDAESIDTYEELTEVFQTIKDNEPEMTIVGSGSAGQSFLQYSITWDNLSDNYGVLENHGQELTVTNLFESDGYKEYLRVIRDWYERGFISNDITSSTESSATIMKAGNLFAYATANKPGIKTQEESNTGGIEVEICQVLPTFTVTGNIWQWTIPTSSKYPEEAMQFLNLMYTNADVLNLITYGIEGQDYVVKEDGTIYYPDGLGATTVPYSMQGMNWSFGNEFNGHVWYGNAPDIWEQTAEWNKTGLVSEAYGFVFDSGSVANEKAAVQNIYDQYRMSLECGLVDYEEVLDEMNEKLYAAGLQTIIDEKQKQLDEWAESNSKN